VVEMTKAGRRPTKRSSSTASSNLDTRKRLILAALALPRSHISSPGNEEWAACTLEVYEKYFPSYDDYADSSDDSPTLLKADAAAQRRCD
jgi:hypothetical protein